MRRILLLLSTMATLSLLMGLFGVQILWQCVQIACRPQQEPLWLPMEVEGTQMCALYLSGYAGPNFENRDAGEVVNRAALAVKNKGGFLACGAVILEFGKERLVFELEELPPGGQALVLEKDGRAMCSGELTGCYGWAKELHPEGMGLVQATPAGGGAVAVSNLTNDVVPVVRICYRSQDPHSGVFFGGAACRTEIRDLQPGEQRMIYPPHYSETSRILYVLTWTEE